MKNRLKKVIFINIILVILFISYYIVNRYYGWGIPCLFNKITGLLCPGCGITRCLFSLVNLRISDAFCYNQLVTVLILPVFIYYIYYLYCYVFDKENKININKISKYLLVIVILFGILRNIW